MTVSKVFKSPEKREMVQCIWFDKKPREHRAAFVTDFVLVAIDEITQCVGAKVSNSESVHVEESQLEFDDAGNAYHFKAEAQKVSRASAGDCRLVCAKRSRSSS
jgi:uncharacterized protein YodC (DUF2158 family)